jgi:hypothetical protein
VQSCIFYNCNVSLTYFTHLLEANDLWFYSLTRMNMTDVDMLTESPDWRKVFLVLDSSKGISANIGAE